MTILSQYDIHIIRMSFVHFIVLLAEGRPNKMFISVCVCVCDMSLNVVTFRYVLWHAGSCKFVTKIAQYLHEAKFAILQYLSTSDCGGDQGKLNARSLK